MREPSLPHNGWPSVDESFRRLAVDPPIAQPGLSQGNHTPEQAAVVGAADRYLKQTMGVDLGVIASAKRLAGAIDSAVATHSLCAEWLGGFESPSGPDDRVSATSISRADRGVVTQL